MQPSSYRFCIFGVGFEVPSSFRFSVRNAGSGLQAPACLSRQRIFRCYRVRPSFVVFPSMELRLLHGSAPPSCQQAPLGQLLFARGMPRKVPYGK